MYLRRLSVDDFRNLVRQELTFDAGPVVIWGDNGQGKSNVLEAIYLGATAMLWRAAREDEAIAWEHTIGRVKTEVRQGRGEGVNTEVALAKAAHPLYKINGVVRKRSDFFGLIPIVAFSNEDIQIVKGDAARRRQFINLELSQINRSYRWNLLHYNRALEQRNRLLKDIRENGTARDALVPWEQGLAKYGGKLINMRIGFLQQLQDVSARHLERLNPGWAPLNLCYHPTLGTALHAADFDPSSQSPEDLSATLLAGFARARDEEIGRGYSLVGPHRDDFELLVNGVDQRTYGSQGQQRSLAVALRLGLTDQVEQATGERPLLLLDDILSELDMDRRQGLVQALGPQGQYFVTTPALEEVPPELLTQGQVCRVKAGQVQHAS